MALTPPIGANGMYLPSLTEMRRYYKEEVYPKEGVRPIDLWYEMPFYGKVDEDGEEAGIITGMSITLSDPRLQSIMIEITHEVSCGKIEKVILEHGFHEEMRQEWRNKNMSNVLYLRNS